MAAGEWIGPLRPDLIAENLVVRVPTGQPRLTRALIADLNEQRASKALTILARAALTDPGARDLIDLPLSSNPGHLAVPALAIAIETNPSVGDQIADALDAGDWSADLLGLIARALPDSSVALARPAALVFQRLAGASEGDSEKRGEHLVNLSNWLSRLGRREEALAAIEEAVTAYRQLADARPQVYSARLAASLEIWPHSLRPQAGSLRQTRPEPKQLAWNDRRYRAAHTQVHGLDRIPYGQSAIPRISHDHRHGATSGGIWLHVPEPSQGANASLNWCHCWWQVLGSNQRRLSRRFYRPASFIALKAADLRHYGHGGLVAWRRSLQVPCQNLQHARQSQGVNEPALNVA
jgi:hypothetical protein